MPFVLRAYDYLRTHRSLCLALLLLTTAILAVSLSRLRYKEDITDFLPLGSKYGRALKVYQEISGAGRIVAIVAHADTCSLKSPDALCAAVDAFTANVQQRDTTGIAETIMAQIDMEQMEQTAQFLYANMPYFLTERDHARMDSLLEVEDYVAKELSADKQKLLFPMAGMMAQSVEGDPLDFFSPVAATLQQRQTSPGYENYDGYIFTPDMSRAIVLMQSPYGSSETSQNAQLLRFLEDCRPHPGGEAEEEAYCCSFDIHFTGGPAIAVGNAEQIKHDSVLAVSLALLLIVGLLYAVFRRVKSLLLIVVSIAWGWLFAMGALSLLLNSVSIIVIGISSVIVGIAVNYPLHLIAHLRHTSSLRQALREIATPLIVGNITTVGAFLALVPLESVALRDLGFFSSLLLVGTILFVLVFLPQLIGSGCPTSLNSPTPDHSPEGRGEPMGSLQWLSPSLRGWVGAVVFLTLIFGYFSLQTTFDANIANINYMTPQQRQDMEYLSALRAHSSESSSPSSPVGSANCAATTLYVVSADSTPDAALSRSATLQPLLAQLKGEGRIACVSGCHQFLCSREEQEHRLALWRDFVSRHDPSLEASIREAARAEDFADGTFDGFLSLLHADLHPQPIEYFAPLTTTVFAANLAAVDSTFSVVDVVTARSTSEIDSCLQTAGSHYYAFDVEGMNRAIATRLSDDFNYIGWACGLIVFLFLWFSLGSLELALLSFLPMAVSWVWILGLMSLLGIQFNVVNIILATFIFGQGDDYTIFMTEGCQYEYAYRRPMLSSYRQSIFLSAAIMFIGIGTLIFARHPALRSLAEVTIVGMSSVVLMAWLLPPLIFRWLVADGSGYRRRPLSLSLLWRRLRGEQPGSDAYLCNLVYDRYRYKGLGVTTAVGRSLRHLPPAAARHQTSNSPIAVVNSGWGEVPLLLALQQPSRPVIAIDADPDKLLVARHSAATLATNITFMEKGGAGQIARLKDEYPSLQLLLLNPSPEDNITYTS